MLTEKTVYSTTIAANGEIYMEEILQIFKDGGDLPYVVQTKETHFFVPGDDPSRLPGYGPVLAEAVWSQELVEAYQRTTGSDGDPPEGDEEPQV